jgi:prepilin-type N-terminal cleavage/methylation domain-containing protein
MIWHTKLFAALVRTGLPMLSSVHPLDRCPKGRGGFTLIEILVVIVVIAVLATMVTNPANEAVTVGHTPEGLLTLMAEGKGNEKHYGYDGRGRLESAEDPAD